jgi:hypothetical protein
MTWEAPKNIADNYFSFVKRALDDEELFRTFRINNDYVSVVGMSHKWQGERFLNRIKEHPDIYARISEFMENDKIGTPVMMDIDNKIISPNTLRHIQSLCDIKKHFGDLSGKIISELGVGYGATAYMVGKYYKPAAYHLLDVPDVQKFALKYLGLLGIHATDSPPPEKVDLFISEYCLSEFDEYDLYNFYEKYVQNAEHVYIMSNLLDEDRKKRFIHTMNKDFNLEIIPDDHGSMFATYIIIGHK